MSDHTVCITGCSRGLGRAMARKFAKLGWTVSGCARSAKGVAALGDELGDGHIFRVADTSDDRAVKAFSREVVGCHGAPDLLINNAALMNRTEPLWEVDAEEFSRIIDVNIKGVASVIRHFVPAMIDRGSGVIVNFSSGWGRSASPEVAPYCATKWAIEGLTNALSQELPSGLAAVALNPGVIDTDMLRSCWADAASAYPDAAEWAESAVPFLAGLGPKDNGGALTVG